MEYYTSNAIDTPAKPPPFDPVGLQPDSMVKVVTTEDEGLALSEHHNHMVRVEAVAGGVPTWEDSSLIASPDFFRVSPAAVKAVVAR